MLQLQNDKLLVEVTQKGAELKRVFHKQQGLDYLWGANPAYWAKTSPVLFPIVGQLKENSFSYKGRSYQLPRHGFARDREFAVAAQDEKSICLTLQSSVETLAVYPFPFRFSIIYKLDGDALNVRYGVKNEGDGPMYFSVGGHPAFKLPMVEGTAYNDYRLVFNCNETAGRWPISKDGLIGPAPEKLLESSRVLLLSKELFQKDAVVLKHLQSDEVSLVSDKTAHGLRFSFAGFPFLGLWAAPGADFLCIEPWCGIADSVDADGDLTHKEGINALAPAEEFSVAWEVRFW